MSQERMELPMRFRSNLFFLSDLLNLFHTFSSLKLRSNSRRFRGRWIKQDSEIFSFLILSRSSSPGEDGVLDRRSFSQRHPQTNWVRASGKPALQLLQFTLALRI